MNTTFLRQMLDKNRFPAEAKEALLQAGELLRKSHQVELFDGAVEFYWDNDFSAPLTTPLLTEISQASSIHPFTLWLLLLIESAGRIQPVYEEMGIAETVFWNTFEDLRYKVLECKEVHGVWGNFVSFWYPIFYTCDIFKLGRLEYENTTYDREQPYEKNGLVLKKGDPVKSIHIPSSGEPFDEATRMISYRKAYDFFREELHGGPLVCICDSWLLHPSTLQILKPASNIVSFSRDFDLISHRDEDSFHDAWRVFGKEYEVPLSQLPERSSMQRAFKRHLLAGGKTGEGLGILVFDGKKIVNR